MNNNVLLAILAGIFIVGFMGPGVFESAYKSGFIPPNPAQLTESTSHQTNSGMRSYKARACGEVRGWSAVLNYTQGASDPFEKCSQWSSPA
jgi:hypothetical protein